MSKNMFSMHLDVDAFLPATADEKAYMVQMRPSSTFFRDGVKRFVKNKVALVSLLIVVVITLSCIFIPMFFPYSYDQMLGVKLGRPVDASYNNLAPFQYGQTELDRIGEYIKEKDPNWKNWGDQFDTKILEGYQPGLNVWV